MAEKIELIFLGTGSAYPTVRRSQTATLLKYKGEYILIDCGEGAQRQCLKAKLDPCKITKILISHWHGDHILGLPGLLQTMTMKGCTRKLEIYGPKGTKKIFKEIVHVFMGWYFESFTKDGRGLDIDVHEVSEGVFFDNGDYYLEAAPLDHDTEDSAYAFVVKEKNRLDKKKLERRVVFLLDTRICDNAVKISKGADILISEATFPEECRELAIANGHLTNVDAAWIAKKAKAKRLVLTHLSSRFDAAPELIAAEAAQVFKNVSVAEDLERIEL